MSKNGNKRKTLDQEMAEAGRDAASGDDPAPPKSISLVIENNRPTLIQLPGIPAVVVDGDVERPEMPSMKLMPGQNTVMREYWDLVKGNSGVKIWLAAGYLMNLGEGEAREILATLDVLEPHIARKAIEGTKNMELLDQWADVTTKSSLSKAIAVRKSALIEEADGEPQE